jgi:hypothetical protein
MAELEIHHETEREADPTGRKVGLMASVLAVALAIVTIMSHRTHTGAVIDNLQANDAWQHYQSTRVKYHNLELGEKMVTIFGSKGESAGTMLADYASQMRKYDAESKQIENAAQKAEHAAATDERRALRYDIGEAFLEIALIGSSLYFISRRKMFPAMGLIAGIAGIAVALTGIV